MTGKERKFDWEIEGIDKTPLPSETAELYNQGNFSLGTLLHIDGTEGDKKPIPYVDVINHLGHFPAGVAVNLVERGLVRICNKGFLESTELGRKVIDIYHENKDCLKTICRLDGAGIDSSKRQIIIEEY